FWARNGGVGMFPPNLYRGELKFDEEALNPHVDGQVAEYVQINSIWGDYRSPSLVNAGLSLPFDPSVVSPDQPFSWKFDELQPEPGLRVRRVLLKVAPLARLMPHGMAPAPHPKSASTNNGRRESGPGDKPPPGSLGIPGRPAIFIQVASDTSRHDANLATYAAERDAELADRAAETEASL